jgi:hypothetical protein
VSGIVEFRETAKLLLRMDPQAKAHTALAMLSNRPLQSSLIR